MVWYIWHQAQLYQIDTENKSQDKLCLASPSWNQLSCVGETRTRYLRCKYVWVDGQLGPDHGSSFRLQHPCLALSWIFHRGAFVSRCFAGRCADLRVLLLVSDHVSSPGLGSDCILVDRHARLNIGLRWKVSVWHDSCMVLASVVVYGLDHHVLVSFLNTCFVMSLVLITCDIWSLSQPAYMLILHVDLTCWSQGQGYVHC